MLAAVSGLAYALATVINLESYLAYFLPLPVVVAAMRNGPDASRKVVSATFFLLLGILTLSHNSEARLRHVCIALQLLNSLSKVLGPVSTFVFSASPKNMMCLKW